jgi:hypothetical protein
LAVFIASSFIRCIHELHGGHNISGSQCVNIKDASIIRIIIDIATNLKPRIGTAAARRRFGCAVRKPQRKIINRAPHFTVKPKRRHVSAVQGYRPPTATRFHLSAQRWRSMLKAGTATPGWQPKNSSTLKALYQRLACAPFPIRNCFRRTACLGLIQRFQR